MNNERKYYCSADLETLKLERKAARAWAYRSNLEVDTNCSKDQVVLTQNKISELVKLK